MSFAERVRKGCPQCLRLRSVAKRGSLAEKRPDLAAQWVVKEDGRTAHDYSPGSRYEATWRCDEAGHVFEMRVERRVAGCDCPYCANRLLLPGFNDFATRHPAVAEDWSPKNLINPDEIFPNSNRKWNWKCKHGHERYTSTAHRILSGGCPECSRENRAATRRPPETTQYS